MIGTLLLLQKYTNKNININVCTYLGINLSSSIVPLEFFQMDTCRLDSVFNLYHSYKTVPALIGHTHRCVSSSELHSHVLSHSVAQLGGEQEVTKISTMGSRERDFIGVSVLIRSMQFFLDWTVLYRPESIIKA